MKNMMIIIIVLLSTVCSVSANDDKPSYPHGVCIPESEFIIGGIDYMFTKDQTIALKGEPLEVVEESELNYETLIYSDMTIDIYSKHIFNLSTTSSDNKTPSGIAVGMSQDDVMKIIGCDDCYGRGLEYQFVNCTTEYYLVLKFDSSNILKKLEMGIDLP